MWYEIERASRESVNLPGIIAGGKYNPKQTSLIPIELINISSLEELVELAVKEELIIGKNRYVELGWSYYIGEEKITPGSLLFILYDDFIEE